MTNSTDPESTDQGLAELSQQTSASARPRGLLAIFFLLLVSACEWGVVLPTLWPLLQSQGASENFYATILSVFSVVRVIAQPMLGALGDRFGIKKVLIIAVTLNVIASVIYAIAPNPWMLFAARALCGLSSSISPLCYMWVACSRPSEEQTGLIQMLNAAANIGITGGPAASGLLLLFPNEGFVNQLNSAGWITAAMLVIAVILVMLELEEPPTTKSSASAEPTPNRCCSCMQLSSWKQPLFWICVISQLAVSLMAAVLEVMLPIVITDTFHYQPFVTSALLAVLTAGLTAVCLLTSYLDGIFSDRCWILAGVFLLVAVTGIAFPLWTGEAGFWGFAAGAIMLGIPPLSLIRGPTRALITKQSPQEEQGALQGTMDGAWSFAQFVGPLLAGRVSEASDGDRHAFWALIASAVAVQVLVVAFGFPWMGEKDQNSERNGASAEASNGKQEV